MLGQPPSSRFGRLRCTEKEETRWASPSVCTFLGALGVLDIQIACCITYAFLAGLLVKFVLVCLTVSLWRVTLLGVLPPMFAHLDLSKHARPA
ncbi:hypothetical protein QBC33DRAFT_530824 [Phialemonium atrogriseum]|uniref:Uncharacterized protein n=1 Tax=Phialemonium atrogriseum TaxID=1093897 RepID=A0AAJ0C3W0_9PEZI|nr:uncharacterized protein QBC33DRAFT_530824 [Phialemonium atrogriseum]KAK1769465.1 hypothetical protein QBC33DRAFT_530824 [Phialemonium atrogriseum]